MSNTANTKFEGVLVTFHLKHLLVDCLTRRTACGKIMRTGKIYDLVMWNSYAPIECKHCAEEWKKRYVSTT